MPSRNALAATDELERTLGGTGWPNSLKHQIAHIIDRHFDRVGRKASEEDNNHALDIGADLQPRLG